MNRNDQILKWREEARKRVGASPEVWKEAEKIVDRYGSFVGAGGSLHINITEVVVKGMLMAKEKVV